MNIKLINLKNIKFNITELSDNMTALFPWPDKVYEEYGLVRETDDEQILIGIAKNHPFSDAREIAIRKIKDESVLKYVAKNDSEEFVRVAAEIRLKKLGYE